jgi:DNA polymerase III alpha subunit (gram-positive type)
MVFTDGTATAQTEQNAEQTQQEATPQESYLQKLVEAKGENWKDPEVLAKGKLEADGYIKTLEEQLAQMREDLKKQEYQAQVLEQLQNKAADSTAAKTGVPNDNGSTEAQNTTASLSEEDLKSLVEQTLTQREQQASVKQNLAQVDKALDDIFGTEALAVVQKKAQELGMSIERMQDIAAESPNAFFALIGEKPKQPMNPMIQGSVRTEGVNMQASAERDWSYYQKLRRENKNLYYTPKIQQQLMEDKMRLGDKFGL